MNAYLQLTKLAWLSFVITALFVFSLGWQFQVLGGSEMAFRVYGILIVYVVLVGFLVKRMTVRKDNIIDAKLAHLEKISTLRIAILSK